MTLSVKTIRELQAAQQPQIVAKHGYCLHPEGMKLTDISDYLDEPPRFKSIFKTTDIASYIAWTRPKITQESITVLNVDDMTAKTIIDYHQDPERDIEEWGSYKAITSQIKLSTTPLYDQVINLARYSPFSQRHLIEFIEDYSENIEGFDDKEKLEPAAMLNAIRNISFEQKTDTKSQVSDTENSEGFDSIEKMNSAQTVSKLIVNTSTHEGLSEREIELRLGYRCGDDKKPQITLRIVGHQKIKDQNRDEFSETLHKNLDKAAIYVGEIAL